MLTSRARWTAAALLALLSTQAVACSGNAPGDSEPVKIATAGDTVADLNAFFAQTTIDLSGETLVLDDSGEYFLFASTNVNTTTINVAIDLGTTAPSEVGTPGAVVTLVTLQQGFWANGQEAVDDPATLAADPNAVPMCGTSTVASSAALRLSDGTLIAVDYGIGATSAGGAPIGPMGISIKGIIDVAQRKNCPFRVKADKGNLPIGITNRCYSKADCSTKIGGLEKTGRCVEGGKPYETGFFSIVDVPGKNCKRNGLSWFNYGYTCYDTYVPCDCDGAVGAGDGADKNPFTPTATPKLQ